MPSSIVSDYMKEKRVRHVLFVLYRDGRHFFRLLQYLNDILYINDATSVRLNV